ncbi:MAG: ABC transporter permease [Caldisericaceae bacterium]|nr:ABC transporter permease [Caldisericaceae bacterium]
MKELIIDSYYVAWRELKKYFRQKTRMMVTVIQPFLWLALMGNAMSGLTNNPMAAQFLGTGNYLTFMTPGIILMTVMFTSIFSGTTVVWDRRFGYLDKLLAAPIKRGAIPFGKMFAAAVQGLFQAVVIIIVALLFGVRFQSGFLGILMILLIAGLLSFILAGFSLALSVKIKTIETLMSLINLFMMPLMFASNALFPLKVMPKWLQVIAKINPITYAIMPMRDLTVKGWAYNIWIYLLVILVIDAVVMLWTNTVFKNATAE